MPEMDGYQTTYQIRHQLKLTDLPIIAMTANAMPSDVKACLDAGMQDHVAKPFNLTELTNKILKHSHKLDKVTVDTDNLTAETALSPALVTIQLYSHEKNIDFSQAFQRLGNSIELYTKVLQQFKVDIDQYLIQLSSGQQEIEAQQLLFHSLKSTAAMLGFNQLAQTAKLLEQQLSHSTAIITQSDLAKLCQQLRQSQEQSATILQFLITASPEQKLNFNSTELRANINLLQSQLNSANMAALGLFDQLQPELQQLDPDLTSQLAEQMAVLAFVTAEKLVAQLKQALDRRINDQ